MIEIDGSSGEGGGQIIRTSLALSLVTAQPFRIENIRARRQKPGLQRQHLAAAEAAAAIGNADVDGAALGSSQLVFKPAKVMAGEYQFAIGTAGSATLVLQTLLPALLLGSEKSVLTLEGGTHNPMAPPFDFLQKAFLPLVQRMGARVSATLLRHGFYPVGGGKVVVEIEPAQKLSSLELLVRGEIKSCRSRCVLSRLPRNIAERESATISQQLGWGDTRIEQVSSPGPGNAVMLEVESEQVTEVFSSFGERGVRAETVAERVVEQARGYLESGVPVGPYLADQLLLPLALAGGGSFRTGPLSQHSQTNMQTIQKFVPVEFQCESTSHGCIVRVRPVS